MTAQTPHEHEPSEARDRYATCPAILDVTDAQASVHAGDTCGAEVNASVESWQTVNGAYELQDEEGAGLVRLYCRDDHALGTFEYDPTSPIRPEDVRAIIMAAAGRRPEPETTPRSAPDPGTALSRDEHLDTWRAVGGPQDRTGMTTEEALARDLLDLHARQAISLDRWDSARALVEEWCGPITENGV